MLFAFVGIVSLVSVPLAGGRIDRLAEVHLSLVWLAALGLALQVAIVSVAPGGAASAHSAAHVVSYVLVGAMLVANRHVPWLWLIALGGVLNFACIAANGGVMPASDWARTAAGMAPAAEGFVNSGVLPHAHLLVLGDVLPFPAPWSPNVFSVGDIVIAAGAFLCLHALTGSAVAGGRRRSTLEAATGP
jgi:hypothetical protein